MSERETASGATTVPTTDCMVSGSFSTAASTALEVPLPAPPARTHVVAVRTSSAVS